MKDNNFDEWCKKIFTNNSSGPRLVWLNGGLYKIGGTVWYTNPILSRLASIYYRVKYISHDEFKKKLKK